METVDAYFSNQLVCFRDIMGILFQGEIHAGAIEIHLSASKKRKLPQVSCGYFLTCFSLFIIATTIIWSPTFHNPSARFHTSCCVLERAYRSHVLLLRIKSLTITLVLYFLKKLNFFFLPHMDFFRRAIFLIKIIF